jgi:hypothetical protein
MRLSRVAVLLLFLASSTHSLRLHPSSDYSLIQRESRENTQNKLKAMTDDDVLKLIQDAVDTAKKNDKPSEGAISTDKAIAKDAEMKAVEKALADRILTRLLMGSYLGGDGLLRYPLERDLVLKIAALRAYHDLILNYELSNAIASFIEPTVDDVLRVLRIVTDTSGMGSKPSSKESTKEPSKDSFVEVREEGVPVYVNPVLLPNKMAEADLGLRNFIIEGVNGFDLV